MAPPTAPNIMIYVVSALIVAPRLLRKLDAPIPMEEPDIVIIILGVDVSPSIPTNAEDWPAENPLVAVNCTVASFAPMSRVTFPFPSVVPWAFCDPAKGWFHCATTTAPCTGLPFLS